MAGGTLYTYGVDESLPTLPIVGGYRLCRATEAERLLKGSGWLPEVLRRHDLAALEGEEGQGASGDVPDTELSEDVDLPAFLTADLPGDDASMMAAE